MKSLKTLLPLLAIGAILAIVFLLKPGAVNPDLGTRVQSNDASAELVDFFDALSEGRYAHAAQYVQPGCQEDYCMFQELDADQIAGELATLCEDHICAPIEIAEVGEDVGTGVRSQKVAFIDEEGNRVPFCIDTVCGLQKITTRFRTALVDGLQYVVDAPPVKIDKE